MYLGELIFLNSGVQFSIRDKWDRRVGDPPQLKWFLRAARLIYQSGVLILGGIGMVTLLLKAGVLVELLI